MRTEIDETDRLILNILQNNSRTSFSKIAKSIGTSESTVFVRVKKLIRKGVIKRFTTLVSPEFLGKNLTAFILISAEPKKLQNVLDALSSMEDIYETYDVTGTYYAVVKIRTEDHRQLAMIIDQIGLIEGITSTETSLVLRCVKEETRILS